VGKLFHLEQLLINTLPENSVDAHPIAIGWFVSPRISAKFLFLMREMCGKPRVIWKGMGMNLSRILLAALGAFVAYSLIGGLLFGMLPVLRSEFEKYPAVYRTQEGIKSTMPAGMAAMFVGMVVLAVIYAMLYKGGSGVVEGARLGR
jgi:hypothetical protein